MHVSMNTGATTDMHVSIYTGAPIDIHQPQEPLCKQMSYNQKSREKPNFGHRHHKKPTYKTGAKNAAC